MPRLVIIGGDAGGMSAAAQARRRATPDELEIVAFERGDHTSYAACGLPYFVEGLIEDAGALVARSPEEHRRREIDVHTRHDVVAIDTDARRVRVRDLDRNETRDEPYDELLIATGSVPIRPQLPNVDAPGVFGVHTIPDALAIDAWVREHDARTAVVVGGGYIGLELAEALHARGLHTTLVEQLPQPMPTLDADMGAEVAKALQTIGVETALGTAVQGFEANGRVRAVTTAGGNIPADIVVLGIGVRPNTTLAKAAGIPLGVKDGIVVDDRMRTPVDGVWATGDCVVSRHRVTGAGTVIALGTHANKQGRVAGINLTGGDARFAGVIGTAITKVGAVEIARTGLSEREAHDAGIDAVAATTDGRTRAQYYPGSTPITVKAVVDRANGRLIGAQIVGGEGAGKRIDALATAIWNEMRADDFAELDLAYAPPFSPVWDPILIAARRVAGEV